MTFGLKMAQAYAEFERNKKRLVAAREDIATCAISGAVGTFANIDPAGRGTCCRKNGIGNRACIYSSHPPRPSCHVFCHAGRYRQFC